MTEAASQKKLVEQSLRYSRWDGGFAGVMMGFTQDFFVPFLLFLGGTLHHVAILSSIPNFVAALTQIKSADLAEKIGSRKTTFNIFVFCQVMAFFPMIVMAFQGGGNPRMFILWVTVFTACGAFANPPWGSMMADLVDEKKRGEYFGKRNRLVGYIMVASTLIAGMILQRLTNIDLRLGFALLFIVALIARFISLLFLMKMHEPKMPRSPDDYFSLYMFLRRIKESNFAKFVIFVALLNFSVNMASPFFAVFMIRDLKFDYLLYSLLTLTAPLAVYMMMTRWGMHADHVGNLKVMKITAPIIAILPLLWIINRNPAYLFLTQIVSGFAWAGFNLCASNFIYDAVTPAKRTRCIAYFNVLNGLALCAGALLGGFLVDHLPPLLGYNILMLFLVSSAVRLCVAFLLPSKLKEVRQVHHVKSNDLFFSVIGVRPLLGIDRKAVRY
jgi:MFS family permease